MGVVHKLKPEVISFVIENKKNNPALSCRSVEQLILEKLQVKVSKSSINSIFKENNLSMPIGRRQKDKKKKFNMPVLPVIEESRAVAVVKEPEPVSPEEKRLKEAEEWAMRLQEEERIRVEKKLNLEKQESKKEDDKRKAEESELKTLLEESTRIKAEEKAKQEAEEKKKLEETKAAQEAAEKKRLEEEAVQAAEKKRLEEEKATQEAALKAEKERWAKLAEEELKAKQQLPEEKIVLKKEEPVEISSLPQERTCPGAILLKALDCLVGSSKEINELICKKLNYQPQDFINLSEALILRSLFDNNNLSLLWDLVGIQGSREKLDDYYAQIKKIDGIKTEIEGIIFKTFTEARGVKIHFIDGSIVQLDSQLHTTWSTQNIPYDFSSTVYELKDNLNKYFFAGQALVLFTAAGYEVPSNDFFNLFLNIGSTSKRPDTLVLFGNKLEDMEKIALDQNSHYSMVFGLWPWQFGSSRKVKRIGEFNLRHIDEIGRDLYLAEIELDLLRLSLNQNINLKGCAIKLDPKEKIRLVVISSDQEEQLDLDKLAATYLSRWPNLEEAFGDFSRKIELFAYVGNTQRFFSKDSAGTELLKPAAELDEVFANYIKMLDAYLRWHFLPAGYGEKDLSFVKECFYKVPVKLIAGQNKVIARMQISREYKYLKDIEYLCRRLNERQINLANGRRIYFESVFKIN